MSPKKVDTRQLGFSFGNDDAQTDHVSTSLVESDRRSGSEDAAVRFLGSDVSIGLDARRGRLFAARDPQRHADFIEQIVRDSETLRSGLQCFPNRQFYEDRIAMYLPEVV